MLKILLLCIFCFSTAVAQNPVGSPALDPKCYFPTVGKPGEIDTIYGGFAEQKLGSELYGLGATKTEPYNHLIIGGLPETAPFLGAVKTGPGFNLHDMKASKAEKLPFPTGTEFFFGHFRSTDKLDILYDPRHPQIYWPDDNGEYDSDRFTRLRFQNEGDIVGGFSGLGIYPVDVTGDGIDDIIIGTNTFHTDDSKDSFYVEFWEGGQKLFDKGDTAYSDSQAVTWKVFKTPQERRDYCIWGDFRGTGRKDAVFRDNWQIGGEPGGNLYYYRNDPPFSMQKFVNAIKFDTLMTRWENGTLVDLVMGFRSLPKSTQDRSDDLWIKYNASKLRHVEYLIYRGGSEFGNKRIYVDSASYNFHDLAKYDLSEFDGSSAGLGIGYRGVNDYAHGDLTGTGQPVFLGGGGWSQLDGFKTLYVFGESFDDKPDMFFYQRGPQNVYGRVDTLTANNDRYQDMIYAMPEYASEEDITNGSGERGTIHLIYGSSKIPVRTSSVDVKVGEFPLTLSPNPTQRHTVVTIQTDYPMDLFINLYNVLGIPVYQTSRTSIGGGEKFRLDFPKLADGPYLLEIRSSEFSVVRKLTIVQ